MADDAALLERPAETRVQALRRATHEAHEALDGRIMAAKPFASREAYARFVAVQRAFHADINRLYADPALQALIPDLADRPRLAEVEQDLKDVQGSPLDLPAAQETPSDLPSALGWLYVAEGSSLGAAFLLKEAAKLGLNEEFGARHLGGAPEGRGLHWKRFTQAVDAAELTPEEDARAVAGAEAAFRRVRSLVEAAYA